MTIGSARLRVNRDLTKIARRSSAVVLEPRGGRVRDAHVRPAGGLSRTLAARPPSCLSHSCERGWPEASLTKDVLQARCRDIPRDPGRHPSQLSGYALDMKLKAPSRSDLLWLLASGLPPPGPFPIRATDLEPGLFGPASVTWRVMREPMLLLGASRALLMQVAHPLVAQGALDHSDFTGDPVGRFQRTVAWVTSVVFGTREEALAATREVNRMHRKVRGTVPEGHATERWRAGAAYQARDRDLILWVHGTLVDSMLDTHDRMIGGLSQRQRDRFVREWDAVVRIMGVPDGSGWKSVSDMRSWISSQVDSGVALPGAGSRAVADVILVPRLGMRGPKGLAELTGFITSGLLPEVIRAHYGIRWTPAHEAAHQGLCLWLRSTKALFPRALRVSPVYEFAVARAAGELDRRPALLQNLVNQPRLA